MNTQMTLTTTLLADLSANRPASPTTALGGWAVAAGAAMPVAAPAGFLRMAPISAPAGDTSVDFQIQKPKKDLQAVSGNGIDARRPHVEKYVPGIPPRGRPV